jgi:hypothetical protein
MIPSISRSSSFRHLKPLFVGSSNLRPLRVMADAHLVDVAGEAEDEWSPAALLAGLLEHESIELFRYSDEGPPSDAPVKEYSFAGLVPVGWISATPVDPEEADLASHRLRWSDGTSVARGAITGNLVEFVAGDDDSSIYADLPRDEARRRREADGVAGGAARELDADLYVTNRPYVLKRQGSLFGAVTICSPADALALVGLYLRSRGEYDVYREPAVGKVKFNRGLFYWVGVRELLPEGWRWYTACVTHADLQADDELTYLGGAVFQRMTRALQIRDDLHRAVNQPQNNDVADEALMALDTCLIYLMGAVDAAALVANRALGTPVEPQQAKWQFDSWLRKFRATAPELARVVAATSEGADTLTILRSLRNSIHGEGLTALAVGGGIGRDETLVALPRADAERILEAIDRLSGDRSTWGVSERLPGRIHADPALLLERLLPHVIKLLNDLMRETPVEHLVPAGVELRPTPPEHADSPFRELYRQSIRWQLGL